MVEKRRKKTKQTRNDVNDMLWRLVQTHFFIGVPERDLPEGKDAERFEPLNYGEVRIKSGIYEKWY